MNFRFRNMDQEILCALAYDILRHDILNEHYQVVASHCYVDEDILKVEKAIFLRFVADRTKPYDSLETAADAVRTFNEKSLSTLFTVLKKFANFLEAIPAISCSAEGSSSAQRAQMDENIHDVFIRSNMTHQCRHIKHSIVQSMRTCLLPKLVIKLLIFLLKERQNAVFLLDCLLCVHHRQVEILVRKFCPPKAKGPSTPMLPPVFLSISLRTDS